MFFGKKKLTETHAKTVTEIKERGIYVLGTGCAKCNALSDNVALALKDMDIDEEVYHITDFEAIASLGVMSTPALVIDKKVVSCGKLLSREECEAVIKDYRNN